MGLKEILHPVKDEGDRVVLGIDPASHSYAFSVIKQEKDKLWLVSAGEVVFPKKATNFEKIKLVGQTLPGIIAEYNPTNVVCEQSIMIQNPQTSRILAYYVGAIAVTTLLTETPFSDVPPMTWKPWLGYKNVTKKEQATWGLDAKETKKKAEFERKERVKRIIREKIPDIREYNDNIFDSIAIALWGIENG